MSPEVPHLWSAGVVWNGHSILHVVGPLPVVINALREALELVSPDWGHVVQIEVRPNP